MARRPPRFVTLAIVAAASAVLSSCAGSVALDHAVVAYDRTVADSVSKQLLLNIARARYNEPIHFTGISSIAATYKLTLSAGIGAAQTGDRGSLLIPLIGTSAEENPTISIAPMQGEEFTQRLLTPFQEQRLTLLLRQGYDADSLLRLMGAEIRVQSGGPDTLQVYRNRPSDKADYVTYRQIMAHLSSIQDRGALSVEPLHFQVVWTVPDEAVTPDNIVSTYKDLALTHDSAKHEYTVTKRVNGRVMISNYDPAVLTNEDRARLHAEAEEVPPNDILVDIRPGFVGGNFPLHGRIRLRSFHEILTFIGRGIGEEPEFDVTPDPRTPAVTENPIHTLEIAETADSSEAVSVELHGRHYALKPEVGYQWNRKVFSLLYQLFQMSMATGQQSGPAITISK